MNKAKETMKKLIPLFTFTFNLHLLFASVPLRWTVETSRAVPAQFEAYQGETLDLEAALMSYGKPLEAPSNYALYWQTNGMGSTYWSVPVRVPSSIAGTGTSHSNLLKATWSPTNDVGAKVYNCFIGQPGTIYHAAFQLRLRPSPGATPNELPLPQKVIDFSKVTVLNPPWSGGGGGGVDTNAVERIANRAVETNAVTVGLSSSVSGLQSSKRDKTDLAVYNLGPWSFSGDLDPEKTYHITDYDMGEFWEYELWDGPENEEESVIVSSHHGAEGERRIVFRLADDSGYITSVRDYAETGDNLATESGVAAHHDSTKLDARSIHWDGSGNLVIGGQDVYPNLLMNTGAIDEVGSLNLEFKTSISYNSDETGLPVGVDLSKIEEIDDKRDLTDNTCHKTEFTEWTFSDGVTRTLYELEGELGKFLSDNPNWDVRGAPPAGCIHSEALTTFDIEETDLFVYIGQYGVDEYVCTATRSAVCTDGKKFTTSDVVDSKVSAAVSTNNPAFVSAVRSLFPTTLRAYDPVRQCWWNIQPVNGVLTLTVED